MDPAKQQQLQKMQQVLLQNKPQIMRPNPKDPTWVERMKKLIQIAKAIANQPGMPPDVGAVVSTLLHETIAIPEVSGVKTTIQGNRWENRFPTAPPLGKKK